jgi:hypothetical protein
MGKTKKSSWIIAGLFLLLSLAAIINTATQKTQVASAPMQFNYGYVSCDNCDNTMTTYAAILGRSVACGADIKDQMTQVGRWMDGCYSATERGPMLLVFTAGLKVNAENQKKGKSPDSCSAALDGFYNITWPDNKSQSAKKEENTEAPLDVSKLPYIDKTNKTDYQTREIMPDKIQKTEKKEVYKSIDEHGALKFTDDPSK